MIYLLYGENETLIDNFIKSLENDSIEKIVFYNDITSMKDIINEANYISLFNDKKIIIINNAIFLDNKKSKETAKEDNELLNYIEHPNENVILIIRHISSSLLSTNKIVKFIKNNGEIKKFELINKTNIDEYIKDYFKNKKYKIDFEAISLIKERLLENTKVIDQELNKLLLYKLESKIITKDDVDKVIISYQTSDVFELVNACVNNNKKQIFKIYKAMLDKKIEPMFIFSLLSKQFRLIYQSKVLSNNYSNDQIANMLKEHPYKVLLAIRSDITKEKCLKIIENLFEIDYKVKTGLLEENKMLETFFIEL